MKPKKQKQIKIKEESRRKLLAKKHYLLACKWDYETVENYQKLQKRSIERIDNLIKELTK